MRYLYLLTALAAGFAYLGLSVMLPIQESALAKKHADKSKSEWQQAEQACRKAVNGSITTSRDIHGVVYCISSAGKLLATITEPSK